MKKKNRKILMIIMAVAFGAIMVGSSTVALFGGFGHPKNTAQTTDTTITGTPADNYKDKDRPTFCETSDAKSNKYITEFKIPTVCTQPLGITTDSSGNIWFTESNTGKIAKFNPSTKNFTEYTNPLWQSHEKSMMWGIGHAPDGNIWYTDSGHNLIWKFSPTDKKYANFNYPTTPGQSEAFPQMIVINGKEILVNDFVGRKITSFNVDQVGSTIDYSTIHSPGNYNFTSDMAVDSNGKIWYTVWIYQQGGNLVRYDPQTDNKTQFTIPPGILAPNGISVEKDGKIWITDTASSIFFSFDQQSQQFTKFITSIPAESTYGNASGLIKTPISRPYWSQIDDKGRMWFNEQVANSIGVFDPVKGSLVEYLVPSKNPNWSDCGYIHNCGVAQVLDFTTSDDKVWFTEWVENNIGVLDPNASLAMDVSVTPTDIISHRGDNSTISFTITPNEQIVDPVTLVTSNTANTNDIIVSGNHQVTMTNQPKTVSINISADNFALTGTYKVLIGARYHEVTISKYVTVTIK
ncbi:MAG: lyase [Thaumarchaeota archaeon]|nr:lyase [Nitrososphaerota archaeon]MBI3642406.1 lyase [Nitrososphaerota archaeon]